MGFFRFRKSIKIAPGLKLNINKKSVSLTAGTKGMHFTTGTAGSQTTVGIPGTGISYTERTRSSNRQSKMSVCPYCGHKMRKQWDCCPKCKSPLIINTTSTNADDKLLFTPTNFERHYYADTLDHTNNNIPDETTINESPSNPDTPSNDNDKNKKSPGCGCIIIILIILGLIGSCFNDKKPEKNNINPAPVAAQSEQKTQKTQNDSPIVVPSPVPIQQVVPEADNTAKKVVPISKQKTNSITYIGNAKTRKFHVQGCRSERKMKTSNKVYFDSRDEVINAGYQPCGICRP